MEQQWSSGLALPRLDFETRDCSRRSSENSGSAIHGYRRFFNEVP